VIESTRVPPDADVYDLTERRIRQRREVEGPWIVVRPDPGPCPGCPWCESPEVDA
jgi:hypothetical protein